MNIWRNRRHAKAMQQEAEEMNAEAQKQLEKALAMEAHVDAQARETVRIIRENHVQQKLQTTFRKGPNYGV